MKRYLTILLCIVLLFGASCVQEQYDFPFSKDDVEKAISDLKLDLIVEYDNSADGQTLLGLIDSNGINYTLSAFDGGDEKRKVLNMTWHLPHVSTEQYQIVYNYENALPFYEKYVRDYFLLAAELFNSSDRELSAELNRFIDYFETHGENGERIWESNIDDTYITIKIGYLFSRYGNKDSFSGRLTIRNEYSYNKYLINNKPM